MTFALATVVFASGVYPVSDTRKYHIVYHRISRLYLIMPVKWCVCLSRLYANLPDYGMCGIPIISLYLLLKSLCFLVQPPIYLNIISEVTLSQFCTHISYIYIYNPYEDISPDNGCFSTSGHQSQSPVHRLRTTSLHPRRAWRFFQHFFLGGLTDRTRDAWPFKKGGIVRRSPVVKKGPN